MNIIVSLIIPAYNSELTISDTILSAICSDYADIEVIIIDDGSTDETVKVATSFHDKRIRVIRQTHQGHPQARNIGLKVANGDFIKYLDSDDIIEPNTIPEQLRILLKKGSDKSVCTCRWETFHDFKGDGASPVKNTLMREFDNPVELLSIASWGTYLPLHCYLIPSSLLRSSPMWRKSVIKNADALYMAEVLSRSDKVLYTSGTTVYYRQKLTNSVSRQATNVSRRSWFRSIEIINEIVNANGISNPRQSIQPYVNYLFHEYAKKDIIYYNYAKKLIKLKVKRVGDPQIGSKLFRVLSICFGMHFALWLRVRYHGKSKFSR